MKNEGFFNCFRRYTPTAAGLQQEPAAERDSSPE